MRTAYAHVMSDSAVVGTGDTPVHSVDLGVVNFGRDFSEIDLIGLEDVTLEHVDSGPVPDGNRVIYRLSTTGSTSYLAALERYLMAVVKNDSEERIRELRREAQQLGKQSS